MIKDILTVLGGALLAVTLTYTPAAALTEGDIPNLAAITEDADANDEAQIKQFIEAKGEKVTTYDGAKGQKFFEGLAIFVGVPVPEGTESIVYGDEDPADATVVISLYDKDGKFIGATWLPVSIIETLEEYAATGA